MIVTAMTPPLIVEVLMRVLVEFGRVWTTSWNSRLLRLLSAMVGVVDGGCVIRSGENGEKRAEITRKKGLHQWCSKPPQGNQEHCDSIEVI